MDDEDVRVWLVERTFTDKGLVTLVYATPDGERKLVEQRSGAQLSDVTAAVDVDPDRLVPAEDGEERDRYAGEVDRVAGRNDPDDHI